MANPDYDKAAEILDAALVDIAEKQPEIADLIERARPAILPIVHLSADEAEAALKQWLYAETFDDMVNGIKAILRNGNDQQRRDFVNAAYLNAFNAAVQVHESREAFKRVLRGVVITAIRFSLATI